MLPAARPQGLQVRLGEIGGPPARSETLGRLPSSPVRNIARVESVPYRLCNISSLWATPDSRGSMPRELAGRFDPMAVLDGIPGEDFATDLEDARQQLRRTLLRVN